MGSIHIDCSVSPQMSIESIEKFLEQIIHDGGIGVQNLVKKIKESNCQIVYKHIFLKTTSPDYHGPQLSIMF